MKLHPLFLVLIVITIISCNNNQKEVQAVQHDTIKTNKLIPVGTADSVIKNGEYIKYYRNGVIEMRGIMKDGKRDGVWKSWYENGSPWSETTFSEGKKSGKTITWYKNGQKRYEGGYKYDNESGTWIYWDEDGKEINRSNYDGK